MVIDKITMHERLMAPMDFSHEEVREAVEAIQQYDADGTVQAAFIRTVKRRLRDQRGAAHLTP